MILFCGVLVIRWIKLNYFKHYITHISLIKF